MMRYTISIPNIPDPIRHPIQAKKVTEFLKTLPGLVGIHPHYPEGTILFFDTVEHARFAWAKFTLEGNECGKYIMRAEFSEDGTSVTIHGVEETVSEKI